MKKVDFKRSDKQYYQPPADKVTLIEIPAYQFASVAGEIEPGVAIDQDAGFQMAMEALYGISYGLKFASKQREANPVDYVVLPMEGLWWTNTSHQGFDFDRDETWYYQLLLRQPDHIDGDMFLAAQQQLMEKKGAANPVIGRLELIEFKEGLSIQIMHVGPYSEEPATIAIMDAFAEQHGLEQRGKHHEIYLSDPRRTKPKNLRTVLRHPVMRAA